MNKKTNIFIDYKLLEIPIGLRYNLFLSNTKKLFLTSGFNLNVNLSSNFNKIVTLDNTIYSTVNTTNEKLNNSSSIFVGLGITLVKFSLEARYNSGFFTGIENENVNTSSGFKISSLGLKASYVVF